MEFSKELELDLNEYNHDYFLQEIFVLYDNATTSEKIKLLNLLWTVRQDKAMTINANKRNKEFNEKLTMLASSLG